MSAAMRAAKENRNEVVHAIERLIETEAWRSFVTPNGELVEPGSLREFIETQPNRGLGLGVQTLVALLEDTNLPESAKRVRVAVLDGLPEANGVGGQGKGSDTTFEGERDSAYVVSRLKRDDPQLAEQVVKGELTPNAAAVKAGIRHKYARIRTDDAQRAVAKLLEHYDRDTILEAIGGAS